jgi:hypothetical protein
MSTTQDAIDYFSAESFSQEQAEAIVSTAKRYTMDWLFSSYEGYDFDSVVAILLDPESDGKMMYSIEDDNLTVWGNFREESVAHFYEIMESSYKGYLDMARFTLDAVGVRYE